MTSIPLRELIGIASLLIAFAIAAVVPFAYAAPLPDGGELAEVIALCAIFGFGLGLGFRWLALRLLDRAVALQTADNLRFDTAINNINQGVCFFDGEQRLIVCNRRYVEMYGLSYKLMRPGTSLCDIVDERYANGSCPAVTRSEYLAMRQAIVVANEPTDSILLLRDGRTFAIHHRPMPDGGWVATHEDITERHRSQAQIEHMARSDPLTGLSNRVEYREQLQALLRQCGSGHRVALLCIDLDRFKPVNDTLGHPIGDQLLCAAAQRLRQCARHGDLVARLGGDEFAIVQTGAQQPVAAESLAERVVREFRAPFEIGAHQILIGASVGVALAPDDGLDPDDLHKKADLALYAAKLDGRGTFSFFRAQMDEQAQVRRHLERDLRQAEAHGELELNYQPIVSLASGEVVAFEALLRWRHPQRGIVMPDSFIPLAEETGLIDALGAWVLRHAFARATTWPQHIGIAVNLSPVQLKSGNLVALVGDTLRATGLAPQRVDVEITESVLLAENSVNLALLHGLRDLGVRICLDDFGVGYSSLSYLRSFPFKKIKIDRSFVRDVVGNTEAAAIVRAIATLGASLNMTITAEGVEQEPQLRMLRELGCDEAQGYYISAPRQGEELDEFLRPTASPSAKESGAALRLLRPPEPMRGTGDRPASADPAAIGSTRSLR